MIARTPKPPYYAVIFTSIRNTATADENLAYETMAIRMDELARLQPGYLGMENARNDIGITISYWKTLEDIAYWKQNSEHVIAQQMGIKKWYLSYSTRICLVERDYSFDKF
ncbi:MAG: antibiotic biosynthesis monooxygenase [Chitinophagaceae bacterium]|nr:antibiotic biosynthesis monooxygenase [Chitinophagaceae bacterium]